MFFHINSAFLLGIFSFIFSSYSFAKCIPVSETQFNSILYTHAKPMTLIFFSTWCADCKIEIEKINKDSNQSQFILVAEFDSLERVNRNLNKMNIQTECYFDSEGKIKDKYQVKMVPAHVDIRLPAAEEKKKH